MTDALSVDRSPFPEYLTRLRTHIVPILFFVGATVEIGLSTYAILTSNDISIFSDPVIGIAVGIVYIILGAGYEWTIRVQQKNEKHYQEQKEFLQKQKEQIEAMETEENND